jgi:phosphoribosyl-AMP cyclohydrolase
MTRPRPTGKRIAGIDALLGAVRFNEQGLVPAIIQDAAAKRVLTLCYLNEAALRKSLETGTIYVFRRSQNRLMQKGETSGHVQVIKEVAVDCEGKSLLLIVRQHVAGCHTGYFSCYRAWFHGYSHAYVYHHVYITRHECLFL